MSTTSTYPSQLYHQSLYSPLPSDQPPTAHSPSRLQHARPESQPQPPPPPSPAFLRKDSYSGKHTPSTSERHAYPSFSPPHEPSSPSMSMTDSAVYQQSKRLAGLSITNSSGNKVSILNDSPLDLDKATIKSERDYDAPRPPSMIAHPDHGLPPLRSPRSPHHRDRHSSRSDYFSVSEDRGRDPYYSPSSVSSAAAAAAGSGHPVPALQQHPHHQQPPHHLQHDHQQQGHQHVHHHSSSNNNNSSNNHHNQHHHHHNQHPSLHHHHSNSSLNGSSRSQRYRSESYETGRSTSLTNAATPFRSGFDTMASEAAANSQRSRSLSSGAQLYPYRATSSNGGSGGNGMASSSAYASQGASPIPYFMRAFSEDNAADEHEAAYRGLMGHQGLPEALLAGQSFSKRKYSCTHPGCNKRFTTSGHLARHNRIHTGERNFSCLMPGCPSKFSRQDNMMQHYRTHISPKSRRGTTTTTTSSTSKKHDLLLDENGVEIEDGDGVAYGAEHDLVVAPGTPTAGNDSSTPTPTAVPGGGGAATSRNSSPSAVARAPSEEMMDQDNDEDRRMVSERPALKHHSSQHLSPSYSRDSHHHHHHHSHLQDRGASGGDSYRPWSVPASPTSPMTQAVERMEDVTSTGSVSAPAPGATTASSTSTVSSSSAAATTTPPVPPQPSSSSSREQQLFYYRQQQQYQQQYQQRQLQKQQQQQAASHASAYYHAAAAHTQASQGHHGHGHGSHGTGSSSSASSKLVASPSSSSTSSMEQHSHAYSSYGQQQQQHGGSSSSHHHGHGHPQHGQYHQQQQQQQQYHHHQQQQPHHHHGSPSSSRGYNRSISMNAAMTPPSPQSTPVTPTKYRFDPIQDCLQQERRQREEATL